MQLQASGHGALVLKGGRVLDPSRTLDDTADVVITDGKITRVGRGAAASAPATARVLDVSGCWVMPGLIDLHTHLREPGQEYKEDIATGTQAAAAGGFTAVCCMPNTVPVNDKRSVTEHIVKRASEVGAVRVYPVGAISKESKGELLADMGELQEAGCVAVSDDGRCVMNAELMRRAMEYARTFGLPLVQHCEDHNLSGGGAMNEGITATRLGARCQPASAESVIVARDLELCALTGARYHVAHVSTVDSVRLIRDAKRRGLPVTCEVTPHHLTLTDEACVGYHPFTKVNPPLRTPADLEALHQALADGTIDAIATDHAPHSPLEKEDLEFELAAFGMIGLETALSLSLDLVRSGVLEPLALAARMATHPARIFNLPGGTLADGVAADVTVVDPEVAWVCKPEELNSKSKNTPFGGRAMRGRAALTVVGGRVAFAATRFGG